MHQLVENKQIATLRQRRQNGEIGHISAAEEDRGFRAEEPRGRGLQAFMLRAISAQKPRSAGADRGAGLDCGRYSPPHARSACQRQIVVRGKIDPVTRLEAAQPVIVFQVVQGRGVA